MQLGEFSQGQHTCVTSIWLKKGVLSPHSHHLEFLCHCSKSGQDMNGTVLCTGLGPAGLQLVLCQEHRYMPV